jgi:hypothetical protein
MAGLVRRVLLWHLTPLRPGTQHPEHTVQHRTGIVPRTATFVRTPRWTQHRFSHGPLFIIPSVLSRRFAVIPEQPQDRTTSLFSYLGDRF